MRGKSVVWDHFKCEEDEGQASSPTGGKVRPTAYCSYCNQKYTFPNATKMMRHLLKCILCPDETKRELEQSGFGEYRADHHAAASMNISPQDEDFAPPATMVQQMMSPVFKENDSPTPGTSALSPHSGFLIISNPPPRNNHREMRPERSSRESNRMDHQDQVSPTHRSLAKAIFATDVPVDIVQNSYWRELFQLLQPSYSLPSKEFLTGTLLDEAYVETLERVSSEINKTKFGAVLAHSRCTNRTHDDTNGQINLIITTPKPMFLGCMDAGQQQSPEVAADIIGGIITKVEPAQVLIVITDLKRNVRDVWPVISSRFPLTTVAGNPIEGLRMVLQKFLEQQSVQEMVKRAKIVCDYRNRLIEHTGALSGSTVKLSWSCTENNSVENDSMLALETLMECKDKLQDCVTTKVPDIDSDTKEIIFDKVFWNMITFVVYVWRTINLSISNLEQEGTRLSDVAVEMINVDKFCRDKLRSSPVSSEERQAVLQQLDDITTACCKDIHYSACLVDPRYCGNCLPDDKTNDAIQYLVELGKYMKQDIGRVLANLAEYRAREGGLWSKQYVWDAASHVAPATWWKGICDRQPLSAIASGILNLAATSSMSSLQACNRGDNLSRDQVQKIMFVRANSEESCQPATSQDMIVL